MEEISVNGENYVKAGSLARELGYTSDYVGQLCRSGQVEAKLIGRSWYVKETSLRAHKEGRYRSTSQKSKDEVKRALVMMQKEVNGPNYLKRINPQSNYEQDEAPLYPTPKKSAETEAASKIKPVRIQAIEKVSLNRVTYGSQLSNRDSDSVITSGSERTRRNRGSSIISAKYNQPNAAPIGILDSSSRRRVRNGVFKATFFLVLPLTGIAIFALSFSLESTTIVTEMGAEEALTLNFKLFENLLDVALNNILSFRREY